MLTTSVIIPTYNRPEDLKKLIHSLLKQTTVPDELIIMDDGNLPDIPLKEECVEAGIQVQYVKKDTPGLTASRNGGVKLAKGDIILFFDDDVVLTPEFVRTILNVYDSDPEKAIGGVAGRDLNVSSRSLKNNIRRMLDIIFLNSGFVEGMILPSGFCTNYGDTRGESIQQREVSFLPGHSFSFRKETFNEFSFDSTAYLGYGLGEDKDFSYRVSKKYKLIYEPSAELWHNVSPLMRPNYYVTGKMFVHFTYKFKEIRGKQTFTNKVIFYYALMGRMIIQVILLVVTQKKSAYQYMKGMFKGMSEVMKNKTPVVKA